MLVTAKVTFAGPLTMRKGEKREVGAGAALTDLLKAGYVEEVKADGGTGRKTGRRKKLSSDK